MIVLRQEPKSHILAHIFFLQRHCIYPKYLDTLTYNSIARTLNYNSYKHQSEATISHYIASFFKMGTSLKKERIRSQRGANSFLLEYGKYYFIIS